MAIPLDQQFKIQKKGILEERIPALHVSGMQRHYFVTYVPSPTQIEDRSAIEQWTERMKFIADDLTWLLQQSHTQFWCEVAFNKEFHSLFDSYLRYAPRPQRSLATTYPSCVPHGKQLEETVSRLMFMCILRLSTNRESPENFFTPEGFGNAIYDNYIFDIPRLFDICSLYALNNKDLLSKMIGNIFKQQPKYSDDLRVAINSINDVISGMVRAFHPQTGPKKLQPTTKSSGVGDVVDLLYYILDLSSTINRFFLVFPQGRVFFFDEHFHPTLVNLFETFLRVYERSRQSDDVPDDVELFEEAKYETVILFHDLLTSCCIDPLVTNENKSDYVESLIHICSLLVTEKRCLAAYEDYFDLAEMIDIVYQTTGLLDEQQIQFYTNGIQQAIERYGTPSCQRKLAANKASSSKATASGSGAASAKVSSNPKVQEIQNLFPNLNEKYIESCLAHYDNDTDRLANALFDNTVPEHLQFEAPTTAPFADTPSNPFGVDDEMSFISKDLLLVGQRSNVYDNDEFDVFNQDNIDMSRIHRGKKTRDSAADLDDKSHLEGMDERYARLGIVEDITDGEYDDEYDDTYDEGVVNVQEKGDAVDNDLPKNENRILGKPGGHYRHRAKSDDDDDDADESRPNQNKSRAQFVENPEVVRERWAQQRAAWQQRQQGHRGGNQQPQQQQQPQPQPQQQHDVVGGTRGRGQTTTVTHNRRWKDAHKSTQGNHNRRNRAAQKANRGLLS